MAQQLHRHKKAASAIESAKMCAKEVGEPFSVWRQDGEFFVCSEKTGPVPYVDNTGGPFRPVATYDEDGTEHC